MGYGVSREELEMKRREQWGLDGECWKLQLLDIGDCYQSVRLGFKTVNERYSPMSKTVTLL